MFGFWYFDPLWLLLVTPAMLLAMWAQYRVTSAFQRGSELATQSGLSGAEAARRILDSHGLRGVPVEPSEGGMLSDHYDPRQKVLRLSPEVYQGRSVSAVGVAAHEAGHALQDAQHYPLLKLRNGLVPLAQTGSWLSMVLIGVGFLLMYMSGAMGPMGQWLILAGVVAFAITVVFQLINLPVEFDASRRAKAVLGQLGIVSASENREVASVLSAAAMTYVAATIVAAAQLLYFLIRSGVLGGGRRN